MAGGRGFRAPTPGQRLLVALFEGFDKWPRQHVNAWTRGWPGRRRLAGAARTAEPPPAARPGRDTVAAAGTGCRRLSRRLDDQPARDGAIAQVRPARTRPAPPAAAAYGVGHPSRTVFFIVRLSSFHTTAPYFAQKPTRLCLRSARNSVRGGASLSPELDRRSVSGRADPGHGLRSSATRAHWLPRTPAHTDDAAQ